MGQSVQKLWNTERKHIALSSNTEWQTLCMLSGNGDGTDDDDEDDGDYKDDDAHIHHPNGICTFIARFIYVCSALCVCACVCLLEVE